MPIATATPVKSFQFVLEIDGVDEFEFQKVTPPEISVDKSEYGTGPGTVKTAGMKKVGNATLEQLRFIGTGNRVSVDWFNQVNNTQARTTGQSINYKRNIVFKEMSGLVAVRREMWVGCFPEKIGRSGRDRLSSDNVVDTIELSVDDVIFL